MRPRQRQQLFFGAFAILWGLQVIAANLGVVLGSARVHGTSLLVSYALLGPAAVLLVHFATTLGPRMASLGATAVVAVVAAIGAVVLVLDPGLVVTVVQDGEELAPRLGAAALPLFLAPFFGAFFLALGALYVEHRRAINPETRGRIRGVLLALALFVSYQSVRQMFVFASFGMLAMAALFAAGTALVVVIVAHLLLRPVDSERDAWLVAAFVVPAAVALGEAALDARGTSVQSVGLWRLIAVASIVYALARYQLFDIDLKVKWTLKQSTLAGIFIAVFFVAGEAAQEFFQDRIGSAYIGIAAAGLLVFMISPLQRLADRIANTAMPRVSESQEYVTFRKLQVYRAALESVIVDGKVTEKERLMLARLRKELQIAPADAKALERDVLSVVTERLVADLSGPGDDPA